MYREVKTGPAQGRWRNEFVPYTVKPMEVMDHPWVRKVFLNWSPQTAKTSQRLIFNESDRHGTGTGDVYHER